MHRNVGTLIFVLGLLFAFVYPLPLLVRGANGVWVFQLGITTMLGVVFAVIGYGIYSGKIKIAAI